MRIVQNRNCGFKYLKTKCASSGYLTHILVLPKKKDALALGGGLLTQTNKHKNYFFSSVTRKNFLLYDDEIMVSFNYSTKV
jgi:hypothetical protein